VNRYENSRTRLKLTFSERNPRHVEAYDAIVSQSENQKKYSEFIVDAVLAYKALGYRMPQGCEIEGAGGARINPTRRSPEDLDLTKMSVDDLEDMVRRIVSEETRKADRPQNQRRMYEQFEMYIAEDEDGGSRYAGLSREDEEELFESLKAFSC